MMRCDITENDSYYPLHGGSIFTQGAMFYTTFYTGFTTISELSICFHVNDLYCYRFWFTIGPI